MTLLLDVYIAYGCGPLSLAVLSNKPTQVKDLLHKHPATLSERNRFGHTPLHLAADKPECLKHLVEAASQALLNQTHQPGGSGVSALEAAMFLSKRRCREPTGARMCRRCRCAQCVIMILKAGCALPVLEALDEMLCSASKRCIAKYIRHMKDRRHELKRFSLSNLAEAEGEIMGLNSERVLDSLAPKTIPMLQERGISVSETLGVTRYRSLSIYQVLRRPYHAELFYRAGFHDTNSWYDFRPPKCGFLSNSTEELAYLHWLTRRGGMPWQLRVSESFATKGDMVAAHFLFWIVGSELGYMGPCSYFRLESPLQEIGTLPELPPLDIRRAWFQELQATTLPAHTADSCRCRCSPHGCDAFISLMKGLGPKYSTFDLSHSSIVFLRQLAGHYIDYVELFGAQLGVRHHAVALQYLTFACLGIPHACCIPRHGDEGLRIRSREDAMELQNEHVYELALLEDLLIEFEPQMTAALGTPDLMQFKNFWRYTWASRMEKVLDKLRGADLGDDERRKAEEIGVVWHTDPEKTNKPPEDPMGNWMHELEKIAEEYQ